MDWKSPPTGGQKWLNKSLEIQILLSCNWSCSACDQFSQFPQIAWVRKATMSMAQIENFIAEMRATNSYLGRIRLVGGEPSLHPKLPDILHALHWELVIPGFVGQLELVTNGSHPEKIQLAKQRENPALPLKVRVSDEGDKQKHHTANLVHTPASLGYEGHICSAPWHCGCSLNYYGYFPCSSGAGIVRMLNDVPKWQRLTLPIGDSAPYPRKPSAVMRTWPELQQLCSRCYHGLRDEDKIKCGTGEQPGQHELNAPSKEAWGQLAPWLTGRQPDWKVYGQEQPAEVAAV